MSALPGLDLDAELASWPGPAAVAVVGPRTGDGPLAAAGDQDAPWRWASVTKLVTALVVLVLAEDGELSLDDPAGPPGAVLGQLLDHSSGCAPDRDAALAPPGTRRVYSNTGIELAARRAEAATGAAFADLAAQVVLAPLGMAGTALVGSPAHGAVGPVADLVRLARELLSPRVLPAGVVARLSTPTRPPLAGVLPGFGRQDPNDWGLGAEVRGTKAPHWTAPGGSPATFGHFGQAGAFLWVDPVAGVACTAAGREPFGPWAAQRWPSLSQRVLDAARP